MSVAVTPRPMPALVTRTEPRPGSAPSYLMLTAAGEPQWTPDAQSATAFASMREAARMALRLPSNLRAFGLPLAGPATLH